MATIKFSRQRESIKQYLESTKCHPTADTVYMNMRELYPNISLGTVYRNLNLLAEQGEILKISCGDGCDRFDGNPKAHYHFICTDCNNVYDLDMESIDHINTIANSQFGGKILGHITYFYGHCEECLNDTK
jgi:Fur family peroxide stress response transcriptional regulator